MLKQSSCLVVVTTFIVGWAGLSAASPITDNNVFDILVNNSINNEGFPVGLGLYFGARDVTPNGQNGTTGSGQTTNTITNQVVTEPLTFLGDTALPNEISTGVAGGLVPYNAGLLGPWTLTFRNGANIATALTPSLV